MGGFPAVRLMPADRDFAGRTAIVTGGARGIGGATALELARRGAAIGVVDAGDASQVVAAITQAGGRAEAVAADVSDRAAMAEAIGHLVGRLGPPSFLVAAAGIMRSGGVVAQPADWAATMAVNIGGVQNAIDALWPRFVTAGFGKIVLISSIGAYLGGSVSGPEYGASKAALLGLNRHYARAGGPLGIYCNAVAPGVIATDMTAGFTTMDPGLIPLRRHGTAGDVAAAIAFLCSSQSDYITGATLPVTGGLFFNA